MPVRRKTSARGLTIVIVRDLVGDPLPGTPTMFSYKIHADHDSMYNTHLRDLCRRTGVQTAES